MNVREHTFLALMVFESLEAGKSGTASNQLMAEAGLVWVLIIIVDLLIGVMRFTCFEQGQLAASRARSVGPGQPTPTERHDG